MANWRDYSSTNYAYEPFEIDEANRLAAAAAAAAAANGIGNYGGSVGPVRAQMQPHFGTMNRPPVNGHGSLTKSVASNYSLPRTNPSAGGRPRTNSHSNNNSGGLGQPAQPDFYFMPSQRRYSGYNVADYQQ